MVLCNTRPLFGIVVRLENGKRILQAAFREIELALVERFGSRLFYDTWSLFFRTTSKNSRELICAADLILRKLVDYNSEVFNSLYVIY